MQTAPRFKSRRNRHTWTREAALAAGARGRLAQELRRKAKPPNPAAILPIARHPDFHLLTLGRVRARISDLLTHAEQLTPAGAKPDWSQVDRLASALERLAELERKLDGRPLPGSRRPPAEPSPNRMSRTLAPPAARPAPRPPSPSPSPAADELDDDPPLQSAPLD